MAEWKPGTPWNNKYLKPGEKLPTGFDPNEIPPDAKKVGPRQFDYEWFSFKDGKEWSQDPKTGVWGYYVTDAATKYFADQKKKNTLAESNVDEQTKRAGMQSATTLAAEVAKKQAEEKIKALLAAKGIGAALLFDPKYGKPNAKGGLWEVYQTYLTGNEALALDLLNATEWMQLDSTEQNKYFKKLTKTDAYKNDLNSFLVRIKRALVAKGITPPDDKTLEDKYYLAGVEDNVILDELSGKITATGAAGESADALAKLRTVAFNNGFNLDRDFAGQIDDWLQRIAKGESINDFARLIRAQAKLGLPEKIGQYLDQGLDLANVYAPYRSAMAAILELTPDSIKLDDPTLQQAYAGDKEMSIFDFKRSLRKDPRWQYTDNARQDVSTAALQILRDFGFQG